MDLLPYVAQLHRQLLLSAEAGGEESRQVAERLAAPLDSTTRLLLLDALAEAAAEITGALPDGSVEVRLRGRDVDFVVAGSPHQSPAQPTAPGQAAAPTTPAADRGEPADETDDGGTARLSLRLPERLKPRVEQAAEAAGLSVNAWLVRSIGAVLDGTATQPLSSATTAYPTTAPSRTGGRVSGWVR